MKQVEMKPPPLPAPPYKGWGMFFSVRHRPFLFFSQQIIQPKTHDLQAVLLHFL